jgi:hypothetical protein
MFLEELPVALEALAKDRFYLVVLGIADSSLAVWRIGRFTVLPIFYPDDPKELPYWIPGERSRPFRVFHSV